MFDNDRLDQLFESACDGDNESLAALFSSFRNRLETMVRLRMDRRLHGRLDPSDVLQETFIEVQERFPRYAEERPMPFFLWIHFLTGQRLLQLHRRHLGAKKRNAALEVSIHGGHAPAASSICLADQLMGSFTSPSQAAMREEMRLRFEQAINDLQPIDREVLALRHFEEFTNDEVAQILGLTKAAASNRYMRALKRLKEKLGSGSGFDVF